MCMESELEISLKSYPRRGENVLSVRKMSRRPLGNGFGNHDGASEGSIGDSGRSLEAVKVVGLFAVVFVTLASGFSFCIVVIVVVE